MTVSPSLIAVVGPTASGKTALAIRIAQELESEIISADSMQFYRGMEIGSGAPTPEQLAAVPHHFVGFLDPSDDFSAGMFETQARAIVERLNGEGKIAVVVGGSGLYVSALIDGLFPGPGKDESIRQQLHDQAEESGGVAKLYARLQEVDPDYARTINANDLRRVVRALEVHAITGTPLSVLHREHREATESMDAVQVALDWPRDVLYARIESRIDDMLQRGLVAEVQTLLDNGHAANIERLRSLGYREIAAHLRGEMSLEEAVELMKRNTRRFAKRQLTWFNSDDRIEWIEITAECTEDDLVEEALSLLE